MADSHYDGQICLESLDHYGRSPTELAMLYKRENLLPMIMDTYLRWHGPEHDAGNGWTQRAFYLAVSQDNLAVARYFLRLGFASPSIKDSVTNKIPLEIAKERNNTPMTIVLSWYNTRYVVNSAVYVPSEGDTDTSDDEPETKMTYNENDFCNPPFRIKNKERGTIENISNNTLDKVSLQKSRMMQPILDKLSTEGFVGADMTSLPLSVSFGLNRPKSLSTGKNRLLYEEAKSIPNSSITSLHFSFFWNYRWEMLQQTRTGVKPVAVNYETVRSFYKQLKKYNPGRARHFRRMNENQSRNPMVPYREIRETLKNHQNTKDLVQQAWKHGSSTHVYLSFIDADTKKFGKNEGLYTTYTQLSTELKAPDVMSTGYEYFDEKSHPLIQFASMLDRQVRAATAKHVPMGVYYPEPNICVKVPQDQSTVPESFHELTKTGYLSSASYTSPKESVLLLSKVCKRIGFSAVYANHNPLLTTTTVRATKNKKGGGFNFGAAKLHNGKFYDWSWQNIKDIMHNISQSHLQPMEWAKNLLHAYECNTKVCLYNGNIPISITDGSVIRNITISLLSRLFNSYDPISLANSPRVIALNVGDDKMRFTHVLNNYNELITNGAIPPKTREEKKSFPLEKPRKVSRKNTKKEKQFAITFADQLDSRGKIKYALSILLKNCNPDLIEMAARDSGMIMSKTFLDCFDFAPTLSLRPTW